MQLTCRNHPKTRSGLRCTALLLCFLYPTLLPASPKPVIQVENAEHDFGSAYRGQVLKHIFLVRNAGGDTLRISNVRSSCGCTVAMIDRLSLAPGETGRLEATFNSGGFSGEVQKKIFIYSDDPASPITTLSLQADIQVDLEVLPTTIYLSGLKQGESLKRKVQIKNVSGKEIEIKEISCTAPALKFELAKPRLAPGETTELVLYVDKLEKGMKLSGSLTIHTTSRQNAVEVQLISGTVR